MTIAPERKEIEVEIVHPTGDPDLTVGFIYGRRVKHGERVTLGPIMGQTIADKKFQRGRTKILKTADKQFSERWMVKIEEREISDGPQIVKVTEDGKIIEDAPKKTNTKKKKKKIEYKEKPEKKSDIDKEIEDIAPDSDTVI